MLLLLSVLFVLLCGSNLLSYYSISHLNRETLRSLEIQYGNALDSLSDNITRIHSLLINLLDDQDLNSLSKFNYLPDDTMKTDAIAQLQQKITIIKNSNSLLSNVSIYVPQQKVTLNADGYEKGILEKYSQEETQRQNEMVATWENTLESEDGQLIMPIVSSNVNSGTLYYVVSAEFSANAIEKSIRDVSLQDNVHYLLDINDGAFTLTTQADEAMTRFMYDNGTQDETKVLSWNGKEYLLLLMWNQDLNIKWYTMISASALLSPIRMLSQIAVGLIALVTLCAGLYIYMDYTLMDKPLKMLADAFHVVEGGNLDVHLDTSLSNEFGELFVYFNDMASHLKSLIDVSYKQKLLLQRTELKQLQEQTNPHFLFNSYFLLHRLVKKNDREKAEWLSRELGQYLKYIARNGRDFVPLCEEYEHMSIYAQIQAARFAGRIRVHYPQLPPAWARIRTPRLVLQPLIENSFLHGLENKEHDGVLEVSLHEEGDNLAIVVEDNGDELTDEILATLTQRLTAQPEGEITALMNISRRLQLIYGDFQRLKVARSILGGLKVELLLPVKEDKNEASVSG